MSVEKKKVAFLWFTSFQKAPVHPEQIHGSVVRSLRWSNEKFRVQVVVPWLWGDHWKRAKLRIIWWNSFTKTSIDLENQNFYETKAHLTTKFVASFFVTSMILNHWNAPLVVIPLSQRTGLSSHPDELRSSFVQGDASLFIEDRGCLEKNAETNPTHRGNPTPPTTKTLFFNLFPRFRTVTYDVPSPPIKRTKDQGFRNLAALYQKKIAHCKWRWVDLQWVQNLWNFLFPNNFLWVFPHSKTGTWVIYETLGTHPRFPAPCRSRNRWRPPPHRSNPRRWGIITS